MIPGGGWDEQCAQGWGVIWSAGSENKPTILLCMTAPVLNCYRTAPMHAVLVIKAEPTPPDLKKDCLVN